MTRTRVMPEPVNLRSRRTRAALLASAYEILTAEGFEVLTMAAVAERAGVTRRAVYLHFPTRAALVTSLFDHIADVEGLADSVRGVEDAPDSVSGLDAWAAHLARFHPRLVEVDHALQRVWRTDPDAARYRKRILAAKHSTCRALIERLVQDGRLAAGWTPKSATDMLFALVSTGLVEALLVDRRWSRRRLAEQLALVFRSTFVED